MIFKKLKTLIFSGLAKKNIKEYKRPLKINSRSYFNGNTFLGKNTHFNGMKVIGKGKVSIGDNFHSGSECLIITEIHNYDKGNAIPYGDDYIIKDVNIQDNVWLGSRVIILGGVKIGEGAIIQAGAVVVKDIPKYSIAGGNPAVTFKERDILHYERLKKECKFR